MITGFVRSAQNCGFQPDHWLFTQQWTGQIMDKCSKRRELVPALYIAVQNRKKTLMPYAKIHMSVRIRAVWAGHFLFVDIYLCSHWFCMMITKALISLYNSAGWAGPALSANCKRALFVFCTYNSITQSTVGYYALVIWNFGPYEADT